MSVIRIFLLAAVCLATASCCAYDPCGSCCGGGGYSIGGGFGFAAPSFGWGGGGSGLSSTPAWSAANDPLYVPLTQVTSASKPPRSVRHTYGSHGENYEVSGLTAWGANRAARKCARCGKISARADAKASRCRGCGKERRVARRTGSGPTRRGSAGDSCGLGGCPDCECMDGEFYCDDCGTCDSCDMYCDCSSASGFDGQVFDGEMIYNGAPEHAPMEGTYYGDGSLMSPSLMAPPMDAGGYSGQYLPQQFAPGQYAPGQPGTEQYAPGPYSPGQYPPGTYAPEGYGPGQYVPQPADPNSYGPPADGSQPYNPYPSNGQSPPVANPAEGTDGFQQPLPESSGGAGLTPAAPREALRNDAVGAGLPNSTWRPRTSSTQPIPLQGSAGLIPTPGGRFPTAVPPLPVLPAAAQQRGPSFPTM